MSFNADAWLATQRPWQFTAGGQVWTARPVSAPAIIAAQLEIQGASVARVRQVVRRLFRLAFPRSAAMWLGRSADPVAVIDALPLGAWETAVASFFAHATGKTLTTTPVPSPPISSSLGSSPAPAPDRSPTS